MNSIYNKIINSSSNTKRINVKLIVKKSEDLFAVFPTLFGGLLSYQHVFNELQKQQPNASIIGVEIIEEMDFDSIGKLSIECGKELKSFIDENELNTKSVHFIGASFGALMAYETYCQMKKWTDFYVWEIFWQEFNKIYKMLSGLFEDLNFWLNVLKMMVLLIWFENFCFFVRIFKVSV